MRIICGQSWAEDGTEEELTVQLWIRFCNSMTGSTCDGIAKPRCGEASQHLKCITTSGVHKFHISCITTFSTKFSLDSCLQFRVTDYSSHPSILFDSFGGEDIFNFRKCYNVSTFIFCVFVNEDFSWSLLWTLSAVKRFCRLGHPAHQ